MKLKIMKNYNVDNNGMPIMTTKIMNSVQKFKGITSYSNLI